MSKKTVWILVIIVIILAVGGYFIFHKSYKAPSSNYSTSNSTTNSSVVETETSSKYGNYLTDTNDNTLYTDGNGTTGVTNCTGACLSAWPVYIDKGATTGLPTNVGTIKRSDNGEIQYTYNGMPLYYFDSDSPGQITGNGDAGFYIVTP